MTATRQSGSSYLRLGLGDNDAVETHFVAFADGGVAQRLVNCRFDRLHIGRQLRVRRLRWKPPLCRTKVNRDVIYQITTVD